VWREADGIVIVNASSNVAGKAGSLGTVVAEFQDRPPKFITALRAMRPHQWVKNLLVFVPLLTSQSFSDWPGLLGALFMFAGFCAAASGIYLANDLMDLEADRRHLRKRKRPFASGALPLPFGVGLSALLLAVSVALAAAAGAVHMILAYAAISLGYSLALKQYPVLDVFILAALYTLRIVAGGVASHHPASLWLLAFSGFLFLSLALVKRCGELPRESHDRQVINVRRGYSVADRPLLVMFGVAAAFSSSVVLALYVGSSTAFHLYPSPEVLWSLVPLGLFWQLRLWLSTERGKMHDDPIVYASRDWVSRLVAIGAVAIVLLASRGVQLW
jgi:4-hydroxybenzoate polyprenyltransferase